MVLQDVPDQVNVGTPLEEAMIDVSAIVTFEEGVTKTVPAAELSISAIPDMEQPGVKNSCGHLQQDLKG